MGSFEDERIAKLAADAKEERRDAAMRQLLERDIPAMLGVTLEDVRYEDPLAEPAAPAPTDKHFAAPGGTPWCGAESKSIAELGESVQAITCEACRDAIRHCGARLSVEVARGRAEPPVHWPSMGGPPWCGATVDCMAMVTNNPSDVTCQKCQSVLAPGPLGVACPPGERLRAVAPVIQPPLHERYAAFRATVERVVAEEAPAAVVVTDWSEKPWRGKESRPRGFCELHCQGDMWTFSCNIAVVDVEAWERDTRREIASCRERLGDRAIGRK